MPIYPGKASKPGEPVVYLPTPISPIKSPDAPPAIITETKGRLSLRFTPYIAGSVIPQTAVIPDDAASWRNCLFFVFSATAKAAPPCAIFEPSIPGPTIVSTPTVAILFMPIGIKP